MTTSPTEALAAALLHRIAAVDGVLEIFPQHPSAVRVLSLVGGTPRAREGRVVVRSEGPSLHVSVRLGTTRAIASRTVLAAVVDAAREVVGPAPLELDIELAFIE